MSSPFKSQILNDLNNVFLNTNEFADVHNINGTDGVTCVIDSDITQSLRPGLGRFEGEEKESIMLFITEANWLVSVKDDNPPAYDQLVTVDQVRWRIKKADLFNGLYELLLEAIE
jgi:hypothetical protein